MHVFNFVNIFKAKIILSWLIFFSIFYVDNFFSTINFANNNATLNFISTNSKLITSSPLSLAGTLNIKDDTTSTFSGISKITFSGGILTTGGVTAYINGTFDPLASNGLVLNNGDYINMNVLPGSIAQEINVSSGATATITGQPIFSSAIVLGNASTVLNLGLTNVLNQSITGAGKVNLLSDLTIAKNVQLPALLTQNNYKLHVTGGSISSGLTGTTGGVIEIHDYTSMTVTWTLGTGADVYIINGNGNVLDLSSSGGIVFNGTSLYLNDINIRGLSTANPIKGTGNIYFSKTTLTLSANFVRNDGSFYFFGDPCRIITTGYTFNMDGSGHNLTVDGSVLTYDQLDGTENYPFTYSNSASENLINNALIKSALGAASSGIIVSTTSYSQLFDLFLTSGSPLGIQNPTPASPRTVAYNGNNLFIHYPNTTGTYMNLDPNITLNLTNIVLKDFHHNAISYGGSGSTLAKINFGSGVRIELGSSLTLASTDTSWTFNGNAEIDGGGATLQVDRSQGITITGANTLTLKNMVLYLTAIDAVKALTDTATIALENCTVILRTPGFQLSTGNMTISKFVKITGGTLTTSPQTTFELTTKGTLTIGENSELFIDRNVKLRYNINPVNDTTLFASKRHILMSYTGSALTLNGCTLESTATGVGFDSGTLRVYDHVTMNTSTSTGAEGEFGSNLLVNLSAGAILDVTGPLKYIP